MIFPDLVKFDWTWCFPSVAGCLHGVISNDWQGAVLRRPAINREVQADLFTLQRPSQYGFGCYTLQLSWGRAWSRSGRIFPVLCISVPSCCEVSAGQPAIFNAPRFHQKSWRPTSSPRLTGWSRNGWQWTPLERSVLDSRENQDSVPNPSLDWVKLWHGAAWGCFSATTRANVAYLSQRGKQEGTQSQIQCGSWLFQAVLPTFPGFSIVFINLSYFISI